MRKPITIKKAETVVVPWTPWPSVPGDPGPDARPVSEGQAQAISYALADKRAAEEAAS